MQTRGLVPLLLFCLLAGCSTPAPGVFPHQDGQGRYVIEMTPAMAFDPLEARVPLGATIVWVNNGTTGHDVSGYPATDNPEFSSWDPPPGGLGKLIEPGESYSHVLGKKATYTIWCHMHHEERMQQLIHVG